MATLAEIKAKILAQREKSAGNNQTQSQSTGGDNASFPFWNIPDDSSATLRFLPDADPDNTFFWRERQIIRLPFAGVVGESNDNVVVTVPCVDMFGDVCPITQHIRPWWKESEEMKNLARVYYKKRSYLFQGFVVNSALEEKEVPENPIRRFVVNKSIFEIIEKSLMDDEMEDLPIDYISGRDFKITKTKKGDYANYGTSGWSFKTRSLNDAENAAIEQHGLFNLSEFLGQRPDADGIAMIKAMFEDSFAGKAFDKAAYGHVYRAYGDSFGGRSAPTPRQAAPQQEAASTPVDTDSGDSTNASSILARIRQNKG